MKTNRPPLMALLFFRWFCHPDIREEIEGDLTERYFKVAEGNGADLFFYKEVLSLFRPSLMGNIHHLTFNLFTDMKRLHWIQLIALNLLVVFCIFLPFLPGPYDNLSLPLSGAAQLTGYIGLVLVPVGALWLIQEIKKIKGRNTNVNNWSSGYYYAVTAAVICTILSLAFSLGLLISVRISAALVSLIISGFVMSRQIPAIRALKNQPSKILNTAPLYLLSIPLLAFTTCSFFLSPVSEYSRNYAIRQSQQLINAIEVYRTQTGYYPQSIDYVPEVPKPFVMGVSEYIYERNGDAYNLSFVQHQHIGATREVVMYNKNDEHNVTGHFADYKARQPHWKYYWLD